MSKGLGQVQRQLLAALTELRSDVRPELWYRLTAVTAYARGGVATSHSDEVSWRRAASRLTGLGLIDVSHRWLAAESANHRYRRQGGGAGVRRTVLVRLPVTEQEASEAALGADLAWEKVLPLATGDLRAARAAKSEEWLDWWDPKLDPDVWEPSTGLGSHSAQLVMQIRLCLATASCESARACRASAFVTRCTCVSALKARLSTET